MGAGGCLVTVLVGAGSQVAGVSSYDDFPPEAKALPRVGALLDPDVERILSLRPDLVITYGSQTDLEKQLARAGIRIFSYRHGGIATILQGDGTSYAGIDSLVIDLGTQQEKPRESATGIMTRDLKGVREYRTP